MINYNIEAQSTVQSINIELLDKYRQLYNWTDMEHIELNHFIEFRAYDYVKHKDDKKKNLEKLQDRIFIYDGMMDYPEVEHFSIVYQLGSINQSNLEPFLNVGYLTYFSPSITLYHLKNMKTYHNKHAIKVILDLFREENDLTEIPQEFKTTKLYKQMINSLLSLFYQTDFYNLEHFQNHVKFEEVNKDMDLFLLHRWEQFRNIEYKVLKKLLSSKDFKQ